ncbi:MAG: bifunctional diaminohydroxyphosphoribosylaminopyrimidine deaminase/5-amino-6-(5-phosphoribosylamino)uracil reductase RibD [Sphingobacteriales bacterium]|nr:bifunctional diaminohydroxyphosphoribosylaminopyrimidine deaminase/5-amino-6-(5-phosphoribosylamino)uracil reductase RibD [Sphingobacteriales bacterium]
MNTHEKYMRKCFQLAKQGLGNVQPNPMVGAVIVYRDTIVGEGYHERFGKAHAEVNAINQVVDNFSNAEEILKESTLYVNLEPCSHFGKTPPCADLIIKHKLQKVVISNIDPFSAVNGKGIEKLKKAGIEVIQDVLRDEGYQVNKRFFTYHSLQRPFVILKWAESQDGFISIAENTRTTISGAEAKVLNHKWRSEEQAILVGTKTVMVDNPVLTVRDWVGSNPVRVIIDRELKLAKDLNIFNSDSKTIVFNNYKTEKVDNIQYIQIDFYGLVPQFILYQLYLMEIQSLIIEGGAYTINEFIQYDLWDEARVFHSKIDLGKGVIAPVLHGLLDSKEDLGDDELFIYHRI